MKKNIILITVTLFFAFCISNATPKKKSVANSHSNSVNIDEQVKMYVEHPFEPPFMLKGTEKWNADDFTKQSIDILKNIVATFHKEKGKDYKKLGDRLNKIATSVIDENKATEPDKGAIMAYFAPIIGNTDMIRKVSDKELAKKVLVLFQKKLDEFDKYFK